MCRGRWVANIDGIIVLEETEILGKKVCVLVPFSATNLKWTDL
jgi:hypothetical protein